MHPRFYKGGGGLCGRTPHPPYTTQGIILWWRRKTLRLKIGTSVKKGMGGEGVVTPPAHRVFGILIQPRRWGGGGSGIAKMTDY